MSVNYTLSEIAENNGKNGKPIWLIVRGGVYDMTKFIQEHPGGEETIKEYAGKDATKAFNEVGHSADAIRDMKNYKVGVVAAAAATEKTNETEIKVQSNIAFQKQLESEQSARQTHKKGFKFFFCF